MEAESGERTRQPKQQQKPNTTLSSSAASNMKSMDKGKVIAQYNADAGLMAEFEQSGVSVRIALSCWVWVSIARIMSL
ncbi:hypothetical protein V6N13_023538 [Hibiscus sabdariffa]